MKKESSKVDKYETDLDALQNSEFFKIQKEELRNRVIDELKSENFDYELLVVR